MDDNTLLKYIALYLPQFHVIPENDTWWGKGFTEWTNTKSAKPFFDGHYQPHEPHDDIGYYDLSDVRVMVDQAQMAKKYGIHGFCYYYYWFNGRTLLEQPLKNMLKTPEVDIPFCLCWANHNWTRSWDVGNNEVLLEQTYDEDTYTNFIDDLIPYFDDERYIKVKNKPVLIIYQANSLPNPQLAVAIWRQHAKSKYNIDLYLICVQNNHTLSPTDCNYDAAVEFAPNYMMKEALLPKGKHPNLPPEVKMIFADYLTNIFQYIFRKKESYKLFRCVYPMWDNTARRKEKFSNVFLGATPEAFKNFLIEMSKITLSEFDKNERFLFINAWNEWAEGTHLEPCKKHGYQFLKTCSEVLKMSKKDLVNSGFSKKIHKQMRKKVKKHRMTFKYRLLVMLHDYTEKKLKKRSLIWKNM